MGKGEALDRDWEKILMYEKSFLYICMYVYMYISKLFDDENEVRTKVDLC